MDKLFESYMKQASKYLNEDEEDLEDVIPDGGEDVEDVEDAVEDTADDAGTEDDEALELDLANPVCPSCGATLIPVGADIDPEEEDEEGNPVYEDDEADAIELLQGLGYIIYKPTEEVEDVDDSDVEDDEADAEFDDFEDEDLDDVEDEEDF